MTSAERAEFLKSVEAKSLIGRTPLRTRMRRKGWFVKRTRGDLGRGEVDYVPTVEGARAAGVWHIEGCNCSVATAQECPACIRIHSNKST